jgi:thioredoxin 1
MEWITTLTSTELQAKVSEMPGSVMIDFYQASCAPCRVLEPRLAKMAERYRNAVPVYRVDVEHDLSIAKRFGVTSLPTVLVMHAGREAGRLDGLITEKDLAMAFEDAAQRNRQTDPFAF